jgi:hypothetical protein
MSEWYTEYNSGFMILAITVIVGAIGVCLKSCISSKCSHINLCCGCVNIERDTRVEENIELATMNHTEQKNDTIPPPTNNV